MAKSLTADFGNGFDVTNLRKMRQFFLAFPIRDALRLELSWTHYRALMRIENEPARFWYMREAANQNWSSRALDRQIGSLYYERLLSSSDRAAVESEAAENAETLERLPRAFVHDPVLLEFLGLPGTGRLLESDLEKALMENLQAFLLELGKGFAFVARQQRISTESKDFYILRRGPDDNPTVGIILCSHKDSSVVRYSVLHENEQLFASKDKLVLPTEAELLAELDRERTQIAGALRG